MRCSRNYGKGSRLDPMRADWNHQPALPRGTIQAALKTGSLFPSPCTINSNEYFHGNIILMESSK